MQIECAKLYRVCFGDPAGANPTSKANSRAAIVCVGMDDVERIYILESWAAWSPADFVLKKLFYFNKKWKPHAFGWDTSATQNLWINLIRKESERLAEDHPPMRWTTFHGTKQRVIETLIQPRGASGHLFRPPEPEVKELKAEMNAFPTGMHRDALDALAHAIDLLPLRPPIESKAMERDSYKRYLMRSGLTENEVRERMNAIGR